MSRPPAAVEVRDAAPADLDALAALEASGFERPWSAADLAAAMPGSLVLVACDPVAGTLPGYAIWSRVLDEAELLRIAVDPARRGERIAERLIAAGHERLAAAGIAACHLEVRSRNAPALALYRRLGFAEVGRRRRYYGDDDALLFRREL